jgi:rSAM/selenodomain-associated transferase 1
MATPLEPPTICMMAKAPVPGTVKTRMCPPLNQDDAAVLAVAFMVDTWASACAASDGHLLARAGDASAFPLPLRSVPGFSQYGADLGERIEHAARVGMEQSRQVVIIGSDLPGLPPAYLRESAVLLRNADVVIGPSADGGFYSIGFNLCPAGCLANVPWSDSQTRARAVQALQQAGLRVVQASPFDDIDDIQGLRRLRAGLAAGTVQAPATAAALRAISWSSLSSYPS